MRLFAIRLFLPLVLAVSASADSLFVTATPVAPPVTESALETAANSLSAGEWTELSTQGMSIGFLTAANGGNYMEYSDRGVWDPTRKEWHFVGQAHSGTKISDHLVYSEDTNTWTKLTPPAASAGHGYEHLTIDPSTGHKYFRQAGTNLVYRMTDTAWASWINLPLTYIDVGSSLVFFPEFGTGGSGSVMFVQRNAASGHDVIAYDLIDGSSIHAPDTVFGTYQSVAEYSPVHQVLFFGGGTGDTDPYYTMDSAGNISPQGTTPASRSLRVNSSVVTVDPVSGNFIIIFSDQTVWSYNPSNDTWINTNNAPPAGFWVTGGTGGCGPLGITGCISAAPVGDYGVIMFLTVSDGSPKVYLYKHETDWQARSQAPGVVRALRFETQAEVDDYMLQASHPYATWNSGTKASGGGSLQFEIPGNAGNVSGDWRINFSDDFSVQFGENEDVYVQWRQRFDSVMLSTRFDLTQGSGGWKQSILGEGDTQGQPEVGSCSDLEVVTQNTNQRGLPQAYHSCGLFWPYQEFEDGDWKLQNMIDAGAGANPRYCFQGDNTTGQVTGNPPCELYHVDEWMTFQVGLNMGPHGFARDPLNNQEYWGFTNSRFRLWVAREGQPSVLTHDFSGVNLRTNDSDPNGPKYGKIWLLPYHSYKDSAQDHPSAYVWYDELIVSTSRIADPQ